MKTFEYKTEHVGDADFIQFVNDHGSVGWRFVQLDDCGNALFEREIEADEDYARRSFDIRKSHFEKKGCNQ